LALVAAKVCREGLVGAEINVKGILGLSRDKTKKKSIPPPHRPYPFWIISPSPFFILLLIVKIWIFGPNFVLNRTHDIASFWAQLQLSSVVQFIRINPLPSACGGMVNRSISGNRYKGSQKKCKPKEAAGSQLTVTMAVSVQDLVSFNQ